MNEEKNNAFVVKDIDEELYNKDLKEERHSEKGMHEAQKILIEKHRKNRRRFWTQLAPISSENPTGKHTTLDLKLKKGSKFFPEYIFQQKAWLDEQDYLEEISIAIRIFERWDKGDEILSHHNRDVLNELKREKERLNFENQERSNKKSKKQNPIARNSHYKVRELFWRTYQILLAADEPHQYKDVWDSIYDEWFKTADDELLPKKYDNDRIIEVMDSRKQKDKNARMKWFISTGNNEGSYKLSSLSALLSKFKKNPPKN